MTRIKNWRQNPRIAQAVAAKAVVRPKTPMNKWESAYAEQLELMRRGGLVSRWDFEPETFRIGERCTYRPDFRVVLPGGEIEFHEVKGFEREDSVVKFKSAAELHPMYRWVMVTKRAGVWIRTREI